MTMVSRGWASGRAGLRWWARLRGHLDILRLITLGLTRSRRLFSRRSISAVVSQSASANRSGGKCGLVGHLAAHHTQRGDERDAVRVKLSRLGGSIDERSDRMVDEQVGVDLLDHHLRRLRAQHLASTSLVGLQLVEGALFLPPLAVEPGELERGPFPGSSMVVTSRIGASPGSLEGCERVYSITRTVIGMPGLALGARNTDR